MARRQAPTTLANPTGISPAATGRWRLVGWTRSAAWSKASLRKYVPDAVSENRKKAAVARATTSA